MLGADLPEPLVPRAVREFHPTGVGPDDHRRDVRPVLHAEPGKIS